MPPPISKGETQTSKTDDSTWPRARNRVDLQHEPPNFYFFFKTKRRRKPHRVSPLQMHPAIISVWHGKRIFWGGSKNSSWIRMSNSHLPTHLCWCKLFDFVHLLSIHTKYNICSACSWKQPCVPAWAKNCLIFGFTKSRTRIIWPQLLLSRSHSLHIFNEQKKNHNYITLSYLFVSVHF